MGAGGVGMTGLAEVLLADGVQISGCDLELSSRTRRLEELGATVFEGHHPDHLNGVDVLVVSSAVDSSHPEIARALSAGVPVARRAEMLAELMRGRRGVAVAGTHGKTTTSALIGHLLDRAGLEPTVLVGGRVRTFGGHGRRGTGDVMVCEADEYDRSFLELAPQVAVVTNLEPEHLDCYDGPEDLEAAFAQFANRVSPLGLVIACADDPGTRSLGRRLRRRTLWYGLDRDADLRAIDVDAVPDGLRFTVEDRRGALGRVELPLAGRHNVSNALAAIAAGMELGVPFPVLAEACEGFAGVDRRFHVLGERDGVTVIDDYAHHPTELRAALAAARQFMPGRSLVAVFQPHLFTRTRDFAAGFADALLAADVAIVMPVYPAREEPIDGVDSGLVVAQARRLGHPNVIPVDGREQALARLSEFATAGSVVLTLGAGDVHRVAETWLERGR
jgi:UDP-N-acetylmuramate--alanine ligase